MDARGAPARKTMHGNCGIVRRYRQTDMGLPLKKLDWCVGVRVDGLVGDIGNECNDAFFSGNRTMLLPTVYVMPQTFITVCRDM